MKSVEKTAKTVEEATQLALQELGVSAERAEVEVLDSPAKGILGLIGGRPARVRVTVKITDPHTVARDFLQQIFQAMHLDVFISARQDEAGNLVLNLWGDNLGVLIGKHGQTLDALQYLVNLAANKTSDERLRIILDVENYRKRREETLHRLALRMAERVRRKAQDVTLEPMTPQERKIIHMALQNNPYVTTYSEGEEPYRKITITMKK